MPVSAVQNVKNITEQFKQTTESIASGWGDSVKERFFNDHIEEMYQSVNRLFDQTLSYANALVEIKREIDTLCQEL